MDSWDVLTGSLEPHQPQVLRSDEEMRAIAIMLPAGEELQEHQTHERAYLVVLDGQVELSGDGDDVTGARGLVAHFQPGERRTIRAQSDTRLLLVLSPWPGVGHPSR